jgi:anti-sigma factor ChrR (cupin superfamily)
MPALSLFHIDGGPAVDDAIVGFVQIAAGQPFPEHTHIGEERIFVIQGGLRDENGVVHTPGTLVKRAPGTSHSIAAEPGIPLIYLNIVDEGLEVGGTLYGPEDDEF